MHTCGVSCMCCVMGVSVSVHRHAGSHSNQKRVSDALEVELQPLSPGCGYWELIWKNSMPLTTQPLLWTRDNCSKPVSSQVFDTAELEY